VGSCSGTRHDQLPLPGRRRDFGERTARHDLKRYRKRGPSKPTRLLLEALRREGVEHATVLDVGGGIGAIQHELLDAGADRATSVEASAAYLRAATEEAERRGHDDRITNQAGDFVALADRVAPADVVTLDRVICCYPDMEALVGRSADRARRLRRGIIAKAPAEVRILEQPLEQAGAVGRAHAPRRANSVADGGLGCAAAAGSHSTSSRVRRVPITGARCALGELRSIARADQTSRKRC
jgi:Methyltransferase domain